jgi:hypothetical protein
MRVFGNIVNIQVARSWVVRILTVITDICGRSCKYSPCCIRWVIHRSSTGKGSPELKGQLMHRNLVTWNQPSRSFGPSLRATQNDARRRGQRQQSCGFFSLTSPTVNSNKRLRLGRHLQRNADHFREFLIAVVLIHQDTVPKDEPPA